MQFNVKSKSNGHCLLFLLIQTVVVDFSNETSDMNDGSNLKKPY